MTSRLETYRRALIALDSAREATSRAEQGKLEAERRYQQANNLVAARRQEFEDALAALDAGIRSGATS